MALFVYFQIFASFFYSAISTLFPTLMTYKQFAFLLSFLSVAMLIAQWIRQRGKISYRAISSLIGIIILIVLYCLTSNFYALSYNERYHAFFLALVGQVSPGIAYAALVSHNSQTQCDVKNWVPWIAFLFTILAFVATFFPTTVTMGGYVDNFSGLSYQSVSYLAAYASALWEYLLITSKTNLQTRWKSMVLISIFFMLGLNFLTILVAGGRGGFVTFISFLFLSMFFIYKQYQFTLRHILQGIFLGVLIIVGLLTLIIVAGHIHFELSGFERIIGFLQHLDNNGREALASQAIDIISDNLFLGHGLGSVFYEMGIYSHNIFLDVLLELGLLGGCVYFALLVVFARKAYFLCQQDYTNILWIYFFLCGFFMSLFSGYYLGNIPMWWVMSFVFCKKLHSFNRRKNS